MVSTIEEMQVQNWTGPDVWRSKRPRLPNLSNQYVLKPCLKINSCIVHGKYMQTCFLTNCAIVLLCVISVNIQC